jgi:phage shock protein A
MANIFKRINDIVTSNINDLLDRVEDPERMVKQIIREMENHIGQAKEGVIGAIASEKQLKNEVEGHQKQVKEWLEKAELALNNDKEELARAAIARKKEHERILANLEPAWEAALKTSNNLKEQLRYLEAKLEEAKRKRGTLVARQRAAEANEQMRDVSSKLKAGFNAQSGLARMEDKVAEMEARSEALNELEQDSTSLEKEFQAMTEDREVEDELAALKKKLSN